MNRNKLLLVSLVASLGATLARAADYADVAAAVAAVEDIPATVSPVFLGFVTLSVGAFIIGMIVKFARKGAK